MNQTLYVVAAILILNRSSFAEGTCPGPFVLGPKDPGRQVQGLLTEAQRCCLAVSVDPKSLQGDCQIPGSGLSAPPEVGDGSAGSPQVWRSRPSTVLYAQYSAKLDLLSLAIFGRLQVLFVHKH